MKYIQRQHIQLRKRNVSFPDFAQQTSKTCQLPYVLSLYTIISSHNVSFNEEHSHVDHHFKTTLLIIAFKKTLKVQ